MPSSKNGGTKSQIDIPEEQLDRLLSQVESPRALFGANGLVRDLPFRRVEKGLSVELPAHLVYDNGDRRHDANARNRSTSKTLRTAAGKVEIRVPRDGEGSGEPQLVEKAPTTPGGPSRARHPPVSPRHVRSCPVYRVGQHFFNESYGAQFSPGLVAKVNDAVVADVEAWPSRRLDACDPIVHLKNHGVDDILFACVDGLEGFPEAIEAVFPRTIVQTCIVHMVRNAMQFVSCRARGELARALKAIYQADTVQQAEKALDALEEQYERQTPAIVRSWRTYGGRIIPFFDFPKHNCRAPQHKVGARPTPLSPSTASSARLSKPRGPCPERTRR